ncbi:hypothetical protein BDZ97DRAFT_2076613 [Flammula alnicola]|nr:hypothetical protein BDZ97DRAFT_2076613 [Flammula alnicola]
MNKPRQVLEEQRRQRKSWGYDLYNPVVSSNCPPAEDATCVAKKFSEEPAAHLPILEEKFAAVDVEIEKLKKQREPLQKEAAPHRTKLAACDTMLTPIRRLPYEILREIAHYAMPEYPSP